MKKIIIYISLGLGGLLLAFLYYYLALPVLNIQYGGIYFPIIILLGLVFSAILCAFKNKMVAFAENKQMTFTKATANKNGKVVKTYISAEEKLNYGFFTAIGFGLSVGLVIIFCGVALISGTKLFRSKSYYKQLDVEVGTMEEFSETFSLLNDTVQLPVIDKDLSFKLAQAKLSNYGAQYSINSENFTIISANEELVRVTPLEYSGLFVSLSKMHQGSQGYIKVNVVTCESELVIVDGGLKYLPSAKFGYDLKRHITMNYPTTLVGDYNFEIDDEGKPYWVIPTYKNEISLFNGANPTGVILCDPVTGAHKKYKIGTEPKWVDRVVDADLAEIQATNSLKYKNGFFNAHLGQKNDVFQASDGYNYFIKDNHTYYVSCMTSPNEADQTSIGFIIVDLKTKQSVKYFIEGITEMRCRSIATLDESVKAQQLDSTWPILVDIHGVPTYFVVLKNEVQYQKLCLINVSDGSIVAMENDMQSLIYKYEALLSNKNPSNTQTFTASGTVTKIRDLNESKEFMISTVEDEYFVVKVDLSLDARFLNVGDEIEIVYTKYGSYNNVTSIKTKNN